MKKGKVLFLIFILGPGICYLILFHTSILSFVLWINTMTPGEKRDYGVETGVVEGTLASGFRVSHISKRFISKQRGERFFGLKELEIKYSNPLGIFIKDRLNVSSFSIGQLHFKIPAQMRSKDSSFLLPLKPSKFKTFIDPQGSVLNKYEFKIENFEINNVLLEIPDIDFSFPIDNWLMKNISLKDGDVSIGTAQIEGDSFSLRKSPLGSQRNGRSEVFTGLIKQKSFSGLKSNAPFWGNAQIKKGDVSFYLNLFSDQVILMSENDRHVHLIFRNFNLDQHFLNLPSMHSINMDLTLGHTQRIDKKYLDLKYGKFKYQGRDYLVKPVVNVERTSSLGDPTDSFVIWMEAQAQDDVSQKPIRLVFGFNSGANNNGKYFRVE